MKKTNRLKKYASKVLYLLTSVALIAFGSTQPISAAARGNKKILAPPVAADSNYYVTAAADLVPDPTQEPEAEVSAEPQVSAEPDSNIFVLPDNIVPSQYYNGEACQIACEALGGMYFLNDQELTFYSFSDNSAKSVYKFEDILCDSYVKDGKLYAVTFRYDYSSWDSMYNDCEVVVYNLDEQQLEKTITIDSVEYWGECAIGVDNRDRIYLANSADFYYSSDEPIECALYLISSEGEILYQTETNKFIYNFAGFNDTSDDFYYEYEYKTDYDVSIALGTGSVTDDKLSLDSAPFAILSENSNTYFQRKANLLDGKYLCLDVTEYADSDYWYDSQENRYLYIYDIADLNNPEPIKLERYNGGYGAADMGVCAVYNDERNSISSLAESRDLILETDMTDKNTVTLYKTAHPIFSLADYGNSIIAVEKEDGRFYLEFIKYKSGASQIEITGAGELKVGESTQLSALIDGELEADFKWESSDSKIASVSNNGNVSAWNPGSAVIMVTGILGLYAEFTVTVSDNPDLNASAGNPVSLNGEKSINFLANDYGYYAADTVKSYLTENTDGTYTRVEYIGEYDYSLNDYRGKIIVENYNKSGAKTDSETLDTELPIFGGFFSGSDYNYLALGKINEAESDSNEILRVIKYTKDWKRVDAASVYGANTTIPFDAGSLRMAETDGKLYIHTCHEMYTSYDGLNHQANMLYTVDENNMDVIDSGYYVSAYVGYTSHSFNQFIQTDGSNIYHVDHGDAYPRGIQLSSYPVSGNMYSGDETVTFEIYGEIGENYTGVSVGGFELSSDMCIIAANSIQQNETSFNEINSPRNIFITITDKELNSSETKWITNYTGKSIAVGTPHLTKFGDDRLLLMWDEYNESTDKHQTKLVTLDGHGNYTSDIKTTTLPLSDCKPIMCGDNIVRWYCTNSTAPILCAVNPYDLDSAYKGRITILDDNTPTAPPEATRRPSTPGAGDYGGGSSGGGGGGFSSGGGYTDGATGTEPSYPETPSNTTPSSNTGSQNFSGSLPFTDVSASDWYYDGVKYVYDNGLMNGTSATWFEPETTMTRGMLVTVLGRAEGVSGGSSSVFSDVNPNEYYAPYIAWASSSGIVNGIGGGMFAPDDIVTREQIAKIFKGYYEYLGDTTNASGALDYADAYLISDWAIPGVAFCKEKGLMQGKEGNMFDPQGGATRAEAATILMRAGIGK